MPLITLKNHRMTEVGRDLRGHLVQYPWSTRVTETQLQRTMTWWLFNISREGHSNTSLSNLWQFLVTLRMKKCFLMFRWNLPCFSLFIASGQPLERAQLSLLCTPIHVSIVIDEIPQSLLQVEQSQFSQPFLVQKMLLSLYHLHDTSLDSLQHVHISLVLLVLSWLSCTPVPQNRS